MRSAIAVTGPAMPAPMTIAVLTFVTFFSLVDRSRACGTDLGDDTAILIVAASGRAPAQVWFEVMALAWCWRTRQGPC
jgi:hypothetical protein